MAQAKFLESLSIGELTFKNRIFMSPMCMYFCEKEDGVLTEVHKDHYVTRALGGVGAIVVEATAVREDAGITAKDLGLYKDEQEKAFVSLIEAVHRYDCKIGIQLSHAGRKAKNGHRLLSPSALPYDAESEVPQEMNLNDIQEVVAAFAHAAKRAERAGFDFIELHAAHGYLLSCFLSPITNQRKDAYGGNLQNRYRFLGEILQAIKKTTKLPIFLRISADEVEENGNSLEEIAQLLLWAKEDGVIFNDISSGGLTPQAPKRIYPAYQAPLAIALHEKGLRVGSVGILDDANLAEYLLSNTGIEVILLGRALLRNPFWLMQAAELLHQSFEPLFSSYHRGFKWKKY